VVVMSAWVLESHPNGSKVILYYGRPPPSPRHSMV
jgi:hypothetical protein